MKMLKNKVIVKLKQVLFKKKTNYKNCCVIKIYIWLQYSQPMVTFGSYMLLGTLVPSVHETSLQGVRTIVTERRSVEDFILFLK